jgi:hypothetical protein
MESGEILQRRVCSFDRPQINRLDILVAFFAEIDMIRFFTLCIEIMNGLLLSIAAKWAEQAIDSPLAGAKGAEEEPFSHLFLQQT